jgi:hypothetical protein
MLGITFKETVLMSGNTKIVDVIADYGITGRSLANPAEV